MNCYGTQLLVKELIRLLKQFVRVETYTRKSKEYWGCEKDHTSPECNLKPNSRGS